MGEVFCRQRYQTPAETCPQNPPPFTFQKYRVSQTVLKREAQSIASLIHPNIVTLYTLEVHEDLHFLTMELVEGNKLTSLIDADGLAVDELYLSAEKLASGVSSAHKMGIVHRDLKTGQYHD